MADECERDEERGRRIAQIRREIADGTYETPDKLARALEAFLDCQQAGGRPQLRLWRPDHEVDEEEA